MRGKGSGRVNIAGVVCYRPGHRPHLMYKLLIYHGRKDEPKSFTWSDYRDLIVAVHQQLGTPLVWCWDNLSVHLAAELARFTEANADWLRIYRLPAYAPELNPAEGMVADAAHHGQLRAHRPDRTRPDRQTQAQEDPVPAQLINGCLAQTGLIIEETTVTT
ncbi:DDE superfamily endonuclease [Nonomuraea fuscirosea]|uniref:DDE superfamily endonuclease n=1 Tax=Nonomuraea fuscirosea TaxID=1291556 RepID=A0A2T0MQ49_9ACTN|nr:DDE superfamily endonuclease [Nonomuraea fuscirosea]